MSEKDHVMVTKGSEILALLEEFGQSRITAREFCQERGINYKTFLRWAKKLGFDVRAKGWHRGKHPESLANLDPRGAPASHRGYEWLRTAMLKCADSCVHWQTCSQAAKQKGCIILELYLENVRAQILDQPQVDEDRDSLLIDRVLKALGYCILIEMWVYAEGAIIIDKDGWRLSPALSANYLAFSNAVTRGLRELGLSPTAALAVKATRPVENIAILIRKDREREERECERQEL